MQRKQRTVVVLGTGGTIAGLATDPGEHLRYASAQVGVEALVAAVPSRGIAVDSEQVAQLDSKDMDFATWVRLAGRVAHHLARPEVAGVVVTHGTDTMEETAYFLSRVVGATKPVVLTGAMRPASAREADGPRNLSDALHVAAQGTADDARDAAIGSLGVVVVFAGRIHAARDVRKVHPQRLDAFSSGEHGALGEVVDGIVRLDRPPEPARVVIGIDALPADPAAWPWVEIVTSDAGADGRVVDALVAAGVQGIVVAATGNGTLQRRLAAALEAAAARGVRAWRSSRCLDGAIVGDAAGDAASTSLPASALTPVKARIALMLDLLVDPGRPGSGWDLVARSIPPRTARSSAIRPHAARPQVA